MTRTLRLRTTHPHSGTRTLRSRTTHSHSGTRG